MRRVCTENLAGARVPKIPEGFSKPVFVYNRFDFIVVVYKTIRGSMVHIRTVAASSTSVFYLIY